MSFPLNDWIDAHPGLRFDLSKSGMRGNFPLPRGRADRSSAEELRHRLAYLQDVSPGQLFLTHGATEAHGLVCAYLAGRSKRNQTPLNCSVALPEYPPLAEVPLLMGFRRTPRGKRATLVVVSNPNNPTGQLGGRQRIEKIARDTQWILIAETYREFTTARSVQTYGLPNVFSSGTFTKIYGADDVRVGFAVAPESEVERFGRFHGTVTDRIPPHSVATALAILDHRKELLRRARTIFERNLTTLRETVVTVPPLSAPLWFDRGPSGFDADRFARWAVKRQVLVCPGFFFGDPRGIRVCLTRRNFPRALAHYLRARQQFRN